MTSETTGGVTTIYEYDANPDMSGRTNRAIALTKSDDGTTVNVYTYDYDGYQTAFDTTGTSNDGTYAYDADKRRIAKTVDSSTTKYFLDPDTSGRKQRAGSADVIADYDGSDALVATYVTPGLDSNLSVTRGESTYYYMKDGLGSIRNVVDSSEATQNTYDYYAFGKELGTWTQGVTNRYTYTAREYDAEAKQYYYRARYYAGSGRFLSRDPKGYDLGEFQTLYSYLTGNPTGAGDPTGLSAADFLEATCKFLKDYGMKTKSVNVETPSIPALGGASLYGRGALRYDRESCCCEYNIEVGVSWDLAKKVTGLLTEAVHKYVPMEGPADRIVAKANEIIGKVGLSASVGGGMAWNNL